MVYLLHLKPGSSGSSILGRHGPPPAASRLLPALHASPPAPAPNFGRGKARHGVKGPPRQAASPSFPSAAAGSLATLSSHFLPGLRARQEAPGERGGAAGPYGSPSRHWWDAVETGQGGAIRLAARTTPPACARAPACPSPAGSVRGPLPVPALGGDAAGTAWASAGTPERAMRGRRRVYGVEPLGGRGESPLSHSGRGSLSAFPVRRGRVIGLGTPRTAEPLRVWA